MITTPTYLSLRDVSPITWTCERFFRLLQFLPPQLVLQRWDKDKSPVDPALAARRSRFVELYVCAWLAAQITAVALFANGRIGPLTLQVLGFLRIIDIVQVSVNVAVFDQMRRPHAITSQHRSLVLTGVTFVELMLSFGMVYLTRIGELRNACTWSDAFYFSAITQLTIGYGDIQPVGILRFLAVAQGLAGLILIVLALGRVVATYGRFEEIFKDLR